MEQQTNYEYEQRTFMNELADQFLTAQKDPATTQATKIEISMANMEWWRACMPDYHKTRRNRSIIDK
jgi:hypothetical protein